MRAKTITLDILNTLFYIDLEFNLRWKVKRNGTKGIDSVVGYVSKSGYLTTEINGKQYRVHRLIYQISNSLIELNGDIEIDHIDCNKLNNNPSNLRAITGKQNSRNRIVHRNTFSEFKGVLYEPRNGRKKHWRARIIVNGKTIHLGYHLTKEIAIEAYTLGSLRFHGEYGRYV